MFAELDYKIITVIELNKIYFRSIVHTVYGLG